MDDLRRIAFLVLFPVAVLVLFLFAWSFFYTPPNASVSISVNFEAHRANVSELWIFHNNSTKLYRSFPVANVFSNMTLDSVGCKGDSFITYRGNYEVTCYGDFRGPSILSINYVLNEPYACYNDLCYFKAKFLDKTKVGPVEFKIYNANGFGTFPGPSFSGNEGIFNGDASSIYLAASLPKNYGTMTVNSSFEKQFNRILGRYSSETELDSKWMIHLLLLLSFESFVAFLLFLLMGLERGVSVRKHMPTPPSLRPPHQLSCIFFDNVKKNDLISSTIINLASRGYLEITNHNIHLLSRKINDLFEHKILHMLFKLSKGGLIKLDKEWISHRMDAIGRDDFKKLLKDLVKLPPCSKELVNGAYDKLGDFMVLIMQGAFVVLSLLMYLLAPAYLLNYKTSLIALTLINLFWMILSVKFRYTTFSRYTHSAAMEKALWLSYKRFAHSRVSLEKETRINWDYLLSFATLFGFESTVIKVAEKKRVYFRRINNPRSATRIFDIISRASHR